MEPIGNKFVKYKLAIEPPKPRIAQVDDIANELVKEYNNPDYRKWYCGVIKKFGVARVNEWQDRAKSGKYPGRLFTSYVNEAGGYRSGE